MSYRVHIDGAVEETLRRFSLDDAIAVRRYLLLVAELAGACPESDPIWQKIDRTEEGHFRWTQRKTEVHFAIDPGARAVNVVRVVASTPMFGPPGGGSDPASTDG